MRVFLAVILIVFITSCKEKKTVTVSATDQNIEVVIDSLKSSIQIINNQITALSEQEERLLENLDSENPVLKNIEKEYLRLLLQREELQIQIATLEAGP